MSGIVAVAYADLLERTRTFGFVLVIAGLLELGYLFVPDASAAYSTIDLGGWRGTYDSAWMGTSTALLTATFVPLLGFFFVRPAQARDAQLQTYDIVASAALPRTFVGLGKWLSNVMLLCGFATLLFLAGIVMQFVRGESPSFDLADYALPFVLITLPACVFTASAALIVGTFPWLRGIGGSVVWVCLWSALLIAPQEMSGRYANALDPLGVRILTQTLLHARAAAAPPAGRAESDVSIGISPPATHRFRMPAFVVDRTLIIERTLWTAFAIVVAAVAAPHALSGVAQTVRGRFAQLPTRLARALPLPPLVRAEFAATLGSAGPLWCAGVIGLAIAALVTPSDGLARIVAPLVWVWPIGPIAAASVLDVRARCEDMLAAAPTAAWQRASARTATCFCLAAVPVIALAVRSGSAGIALVAIGVAAAAVGAALGTLTRSPVLFECCALLVWYIGAVNGVRALDPASAVDQPAAVVAVSVMVTAMCLALSTYRLAHRKR